MLAIGPYSGNEAVMDIEFTSGGVFDTKFDAYWQDLDILFLETGWPGNTEERKDQPKIPVVATPTSAERRFGSTESASSNFAKAPSLSPALGSLLRLPLVSTKARNPLSKIK